MFGLARFIGIFFNNQNTSISVVVTSHFILIPKGHLKHENPVVNQITSNDHNFFRFI